MLSVKSASVVGVIVRVARFQPMMSTEVLPVLAVNVCPEPSPSVAPTGMLPITSEESVLSPLAEAVICSGIAVPSTPSTATAETVGASGSTTTSSVVLVEWLWPPLSVAVAVMLKVKLVSLAALIVRVERFQPMISTEVEPDCAVNVGAVAQRRADRDVADQERGERTVAIRRSGDFQRDRCVLNALY